MHVQTKYYSYNIVMRFLIELVFDALRRPITTEKNLQVNDFFGRGTCLVIRNPICRETFIENTHKNKFEFSPNSGNSATTLQGRGNSLND